MKIIAKNSWLLFQAIPQNYIEESVIKDVFINGLNIEENTDYIEGWSYFLPIRPGEIIAFTKSENGFGYAAFLKSIDNIEVDMAPDLCEGTSRMENNTTSLSLYTAPQDAKYLWIAGKDSVTGGTYTPMKLTINNGYNIIPELKEKHGKL